MQLINLTGLTRIGNMTGSGGLNAIMDASLSNVGWSEASSGWAGVTLSTPSKIVQAEAISADNGFNASSNNSTNITLKLYGKTGAAPTSPTDGTLLATLGPFTDTDSNTTKTLTSSDQTTEFSHVWVTVSTGIWCILAALKIYAPDAPIPPTEYWPTTPTDGGNRYTKNTVCNELVPLTYEEMEVKQFRTAIFTNAAAVATLDFRCDCRHEMPANYMGVVEVISYFTVRTGDTYEQAKAATPQQVKPSRGGNIRDHTHHYIAMNDMAKVSLQANKYYIFSVKMKSDAGSGNTTNGMAAILAEGEPKVGCNNFHVTVDKSEILL